MPMPVIAGRPSGLGLVVFNEATQTPIVFVGQTTTLCVRLDNNTGGALGFAPGASPSTLRIHPPAFYTADDRRRMSIALAGWDFAADDHDRCLVLTCRDPGSLPDGQSLTVRITAAASASPVDCKALVVEPDNVTGDVPLELRASVKLSAPPTPDHPQLPHALHVSLENEGLVYVSKPEDLLPNTITLNFKNVGPDALYVGKAPRTGAATATVTFVYGTTSGALAQDIDRDQPPIGSAWRITAQLQNQQGGAWAVENPRASGEDLHPQWIFKASGTNQGILGTDSQANATFAFRQIVSLTPPGHTQMIVHMTGFARDENTRYDDAVYTLDIRKDIPPPRGLVTFEAAERTVTITRPDQSVTINLRWSLFGVAKVRLVATGAHAEPWSKDYSADPGFVDAPLRADDSHPVALTDLSHSPSVDLALEAYDGRDRLLNRLSCPVFIDAQMFIDPADGQVYPVMRSGTRVWMAANLKREVAGARPGGSGNLYPASLAAANVPPPWRLPLDSDWEALVRAFATDEDAYAALIAGGAAGFNATLDGYLDRRRALNDSGKDGAGYYWSATPDPRDGSKRRFVTFSTRGRRVNRGDAFSGEFALAVRWVRDA